MDFMQTLYKREIGYRSLKSYDFAIKRLKCYDYKEFCGIYISSDAPDSPVFACKFCSKANYEHWIALANEDGMLAVQDTNIVVPYPTGNETYAAGIRAHNNAVFDLAWMEEEFKVVSVSGDNTAVLWDVSTTPLRRLHHFKGHTKSVKTVAFRPQDKAVFATGARDGFIMIWDTRSNQGLMWEKPDNFISNSHHAQGQGLPSGRRSRKSKTAPVSRASSITGLIFQDHYRLISCGAGDGLIKVWDLRKNYSAYKREPHPCYTLKYPGNTTRNGFTNLVLDPGKVKLYASCMDSVIYCYNVATYEDKTVASFTGHDSSTFYVKSSLSPDGMYLTSGSSDERAYIWNTQGSHQPVVSLVGHGAEVTSVQWCPVGDPKIVTCSDDCRLRIWQVGHEFEDYNDIVQVRGWAEVPELPNEDEGSRAISENVGTPPRAIKLHANQQERTPECQHVTPLPQCSSFDRQVLNGRREQVTPHSVCLRSEESPNTNVRNPKRRLTDYIDDGSDKKRLVLSPVREENLESKIEPEFRGARRLFSPCRSAGGTTTQVTADIESSPTLNLPNYVLDGTSPHHRCSPNSRLKENVDWLTKLRKERSVCGERSATSPNCNITPKRKTTRSRSHEFSKGVSPKGNSETLLKFFRVSGKPSGETWNCSSSQRGSSPVVSTVETDNL